MIDEEIYQEFEKALLEALSVYRNREYVSFETISEFIEDRVWESTIKYNRMQNVTKEKFFENLYRNTTVDEYAQGVIDLWNVDHEYMNKAIKELREMVIANDFYNAEKYGKVTEHSIKLENSWREFKLTDEEYYKLNPERDFRILEQRYVNRHIKLYENIKKRYENSKNKARDLADFLKEYERLDKTIPYFSHETGDIIRYVDIKTYLNMLYNVYLTRSAWNRSIYDANILGNHLWYLPAHPYSCPHCMKYQGYVYVDKEPNLRELTVLRRYGKPGYWQKEKAIEGDVEDKGIAIGHPNCKHVWVSYWSQEQIQDEKYDSSEWEEKYKTQQKIQSLELEKSRLLSNRRIYKELDQQDLVDRTTERIKQIREKIKDLS